MKSNTTDNQHLAVQSWTTSRGKTVPEHLWRLRASIFFSMLSAFIIEMLARYFRSNSAASVVTSKSLSLIAILLLSVSALYLIFLLDKRSVLKGMVVIATFCLLFSQVLTILRELPAFTGRATWYAPYISEIEGPLLLMGIVLLLAAFYFALLDTVYVKALLRRQQITLIHEMEQRELAQSELKTSHDQLRLLSAHIETVREDERARIAREIHDELGQTLTSFKIDLTHLKRRLPGDLNGDCKQILDSLSQQIDATVRTTRRLMTELHPAILDDLGLQAAVEWLVFDFRKRTGIDCALNVDSDQATIDMHRTTVLFRIVQECLTNIIKHAEATRVEVNYSVKDGRIALEVSDNGQGIEKKANDNNGRRFGILGMRERVTLLGGDFDVRSANGNGTRVLVSIPCDGKG